ncbi:unnamed protein product [Protopolystoma xenopodis]|uniref:Uncharacterized protein n=1 Tax=Protopolystoma xenopodis TaxID=117903 RepID=A0A3S5CFQ7_9PLAT|nr:unnamed protein product [Protopolystoma xenopodis]
MAEKWMLFVHGSKSSPQSPRIGKSDNNINLYSTVRSLTRLSEVEVIFGRMPDALGSEQLRTILRGMINSDGGDWLECSFSRPCGL